MHAMNIETNKTTVDLLGCGGRSKVSSVLDEKKLPCKNEEEDEPSSSQQFPLSQTDETIRQLERDGKIKDVVGAQSILSQELCAYRKPEDEDEDGQFANIHSSQQECETHTSMAKRLGLLTQDDDDDDDNDEKEEQAEERGRPHTPVPTAATGKVSMLRDTPIRESECFGSLLEAVQKITEQEDLNGIYSLLEQQQQKKKQQCDSAGVPLQLKVRTKTQSRKRKSSPNESKPKSKVAKRKKKLQEEQEAQERAKRAAVLAEQTVADPEMAKKLLLSMALVRENPRSSPETWPSRGSIVGEGFFWAHYPPLEIVLKKKMEKYYELSTTKCQSAQQQAFNNNLVVLVKDSATEQGWKFDNCFSDKCLRDRIRCYYKTHIQNAKKRLKTMIRNPTKRANAKHLCEHLDLIESHKEESQELQSDEDTAELSDDESEEEVEETPKSTRRRSRTRSKSSKVKR